MIDARVHRHAKIAKTGRYQGRCDRIRHHLQHGPLTSGPDEARGHDAGRSGGTGPKETQGRGQRFCRHRNLPIGLGDAQAVKRQSGHRHHPPPHARAVGAAVSAGRAPCRLRKTVCHHHGPVRPDDRRGEAAPASAERLPQPALGRMHPRSGEAHRPRRDRRHRADRSLRRRV